jgi:ATP-dependent Clp protease ATP-binding subunit ClpC
MRFDLFTYAAKTLLKEAGDLVYVYEHDVLDVEHLLLALLRQPDGLAARSLAALGVEPSHVLAELEARLKTVPALGNLIPHPDRLMYSGRMARLGSRCVQIVERMGDRYIDLAHLFLGVVTEGEGPAFQILLAAGLEPKELIEQVKTIYRADARTTGRDLAGRAREVILELLELAPEMRPEDYLALGQALETLAAELRDRALPPPDEAPPGAP